MTHPISRVSGDSVDGLGLLHQGQTLCLDLLTHIGAQQIRVRGDEITCRCLWPENHYRGDENPSMSMNAWTTQFHCWSCGAKGNGFTLVREFTNEEPSRYERKTSRTSGSASEIFEQAATALRLLTRGVAYTKVVTTLTELYGISARTAKYRIATARGTLRVSAEGGKNIGSRMRFVSSLLQRSGRERLPTF
jgi:hypothetical protein